MSATLASMLARVRDLLADSGADLWMDASLTEALRLALGEYNLAAQIDAPAGPLTVLQGLDGALETSLPAAHESLLVWGAAAWAAQGRAVDRAGLQDGGAESQVFKAWGDARLGEFKAMLAALFPGYRAALHGEAASAAFRGDEAARLADLRSAVNPPWGVWAED